MFRILFVLLIVGILGCSGNEPSTLYYANMSGVVSPYLEYRLQGEITKTLADSIGRFYKVKLDEKDRLQEIQFFKRNQPSSDSYFKAHQVRYQYSNNETTRAYYDESGAKTIMWRHYYQGGNIHKEIYGLDENGRKLELILRDTSDIAVSSGSGVYQYTWQHIDQYKVLQTHHDSIGNSTIFRAEIPFERLFLKIEEKGFEHSLTRVNKNNIPEEHPSEGYATLQLIFDEYGNEIGWSHHDTEMQLVNLQNEFNHSKCLFEKEYFDQRLGMMKSFSERYFDNTGRRVQNSDSVHAIRYALNTHGDLKSIAYFNSELKPQNNLSNGFHKAEVQYDSIGNRIAILKYNSENQLIN
ncbi:MAG: hypothetical protein NXI20_00625 [bacterium]|nr:hypothetical protein [bacterium]